VFYIPTETLRGEFPSNTWDSTLQRPWKGRTRAPAWVACRGNLDLPRWGVVPGSECAMLAGEAGASRVGCWTWLVKLKHGPGPPLVRQPQGKWAGLELALPTGAWKRLVNTTNPGMQVRSSVPKKGASVGVYRQRCEPRPDC
jgi:hypothetical protein